MIPSQAPLDEQTFSATFQHFYERWTRRNARFERIDKVIRGEWLTVDLEDNTQESRSPNLIQVALEDTAEAASLVPSVRVAPSGTTIPAKTKAEKMEQLGTSYLDQSEIQLLTIKSLMHLAGHGMFSWVVTNDPDIGPRIELRDPRTCYPEPDVSSLGVTQRCFFARDMYLTQLPEQWQARFQDHMDLQGLNPRYFTDHAVSLVEYYDKDETIIAITYDSAKVPDIGFPLNKPGTSAGRVTVIIERRENKTGLCPVIIGQRLSLDPEPRGQFDQVISVLEAHIRLMALVLDYADQAVYSDVWVKGLIGSMPMGGGSYIQLDPNGGDIGRVPPAVTSLSVYNEMSQLIDSIHLGGRWPKTRPGDIDQAIASGKFIESTVGMMNTVIRTYHLIMGRAIEQALRVLFKWDKLEGKERTVAGILRNQQFQLDRKQDDIDLTAKIRASYGIGLGHTPSESMVMGIQAQAAGIVSLEFVQENFEGIEDVGLERIRIDVQQIRDMMFAELLAGTQNGTVPKSVLPEIMNERMNGKHIAELFKKYVVEPEQQMQDSMLQSGLGGPPMMPGAPPPGGIPASAPAPPPGMLESLFGGAPPAEEEPPSTINRTSVPTGPGSFSGVQTGG